MGGILVLKEGNREMDRESKDWFAGLFRVSGIIFFVCGIVLVGTNWYDWNPYGGNFSSTFLANKIFRVIIWFFLAWLGTVFITWSHRLRNSQP